MLVIAKWMSLVAAFSQTEIASEGGGSWKEGSVRGAKGLGSVPNSAEIAAIGEPTELRALFCSPRSFRFPHYFSLSFWLRLG